MNIELDAPVPAFGELLATSNKSISIESLNGQYTLFYFYPKDDTPGCTIESQDFTNLYSEFQSFNCQIFGVSRDSLKSHENFKEKYTMPFELISDPEETLCTMFDVLKMKNMYGKQVRGIERSTFLMNPNGIVQAEWREVKVPGHAEAVLEKLKLIV